MDAYRAKLDSFDPDIAHAIAGEERRQLDGVEMIPSENYTYPEVLAALGSVLTNKYSEGYPGRRYYGGQQYTDAVENIARDRACALFRAEHANVQPLSGSPMNQACCFAFLNPGDTVLAMDLSHGGHLTHGAPVSHMGKVFNFVRYKSAPQQGGAIDFDELMDIAKATRPKIVLCGYSSYPRDYDYAAFKKVADAVGALTMADISHIGGLVAANVMRNPFDSGFDVVTTPTHKTLRGPRRADSEEGGLREEDRQLGLPWSPGRPAYERNRRWRNHLQEGGGASIRRIRARDSTQFKGVGRGASRRRRDTDHRRHR
jgi:glycine hydroxymethyltransferase